MDEWNTQRIFALQYVTSCCFVNDGTHIVCTGYEEKDITIWNTTTGESEATLKGHTSHVWNCACAKDGSFLVSGSDSPENCLRIWDIKSLKCVRILVGHESAVLCCCFSPNGENIVSGENNGVLKVWRVSDGECVMTIRSNNDAVVCCSYSPSGQRLLSGSRDGTVKLWDAITGNPIQSFNTQNGVMVSCCGFLPNEKQLIYGYYDTLEVCSIESSSILSLRGHVDFVRCCSVSPDGSFIVTGSEDKTLKIWEVSTGTCSATLEGHHGDVVACEFSSDGTTILSGSSDATLLLWDIRKLLRSKDRTAI